HNYLFPILQTKKLARHSYNIEISVTKKENPVNTGLQGYNVPWVGIEPTRPKTLDFESSASTNSATKAWGILSNASAKLKNKINPHQKIPSIILEQAILIYKFAPR